MLLRQILSYNLECFLGPAQGQWLTIDETRLIFLGFFLVLSFDLFKHLMRSIAKLLECVLDRLSVYLVLFLLLAACLDLDDWLVVVLLIVKVPLYGITEGCRL